MSERYTRKDAEQAARRLAEVLGLDYGHYVIVDDEPEELPNARDGGRYKVQIREGKDAGKWITTQPNAIEIDYNPTYGGVAIHHIAPDGGTWVTSGRFSQTRRTPREFVAYVNTLIAGMYMEQDRS